MWAKRLCELLTTIVVAGVLYSGCLTPVMAQNTQCSDRPPGDSSNACANTRFVGTALSGVPTLSGNNTWTGDNFFGSGRPYIDVRAKGAKGDGIIDDTAAIQSAITAAENSPIIGAAIYFPQGHYCVFSGITHNVNVGIRFVGTGIGGTIVDSCNHDVTTFTLNGSQSSIESMQVWGFNSTTVSANHDAIVLGTNCVQCRLNNVGTLFGYYNIDVAGVDHVFDIVLPSSAYGPALVHITAGGYHRRDQNDQVPPSPCNFPSYGTTINAWAANTAYTACTIVSFGGFYIQAISVTGDDKSGAVFPGLQPYLTNIVDNHVTWQLLAPTTYYGMWIDGGTTVFYSDQGDYTGPFTESVRIDNANAAGVPADIFLSNITGGDTFTSVIGAHAGHHLYVTDGGNIGPCLATNCAGVLTADTWAGNTYIYNSLIAGNHFGVSIQSGNNFAIHGNNFLAGGLTSTVGVNISCPLVQFSVIGNTFGSATSSDSMTGVSLSAAACNTYEVLGNIFNITGSGVSDGGTGSTKYIESNGGVVLSNATSGNQGSGTINIAGDYYKNGTKIPETVSSPLVLTGGALSLPTSSTVQFTSLGLGIAAPTTGIQIGNALVLPSGNSQLALGSSTAGGALIAGQGSTDDVRIENKSGSVACNLPTGTTTFNCTQFQAPNTQTAYLVTAVSGSNAAFGMGVAGTVFFNMGSAVDTFAIRDHTSNSVFTVAEGTPGTTSTTTTTYLGVLVAGGSPPTPSGSCSVNTQTGGNTAGTFKANGGCAGGTVILTFSATAPTGYVCDAHDQTTPADLMNQTANSPTSVTLTGTMANADVVAFKCMAF